VNGFAARYITTKKNIVQYFFKKIAESLIAKISAALAR
jgi:hypothetical protein